jgi:tRNA-2-methylthio-N6-dimethylallyladenosine synthase
MNKFYIKTFGCQQNVADSERLISYYEGRGYERVLCEKDAQVVVINSCMIRDMAEERVYGYIRNLQRASKKDGRDQHVILTGCIVGAAAREPSGKMQKKLAKRIPNVELLPIEDVGFEIAPHRQQKDHAWVVISNGCNNHCSFCIVPFARGKEISRPFEDIVDEVHSLVKKGYSSITLLGQNVNSYGADLILNAGQKAQDPYALSDGSHVMPVMVNHLGRTRIPTLFPHLLETVAQIQGVQTVTFTSSNPWDFSDELIDVIARNKNIDRLLHLPVQAGSDRVIKNMNRWYSADEFLSLINKMIDKIPNVQFATDIIVGFPGETEKDFEKTVDLVKKVGFVKAFIGCYSERPGTIASKEMTDDVSWDEKKRRWHILNDLINKPNIGVSKTKDWIRTREEHSVK